MATTNNRSEIEKFLIDENKHKMGDRSPNENKKPPSFNLYLAAIISNLSSFAAGNTLTWSSPTIAKLEEDKLITKGDQDSWLASLIALGATFGPFIAGALLDRIGRKPTLLLTSVFFLTSWAMIATSFTLPEINYPLIYAARVIAGMSCGIVYTAIPVYIGEISTDEIRSALGTVMSVFLIAGFLMQYVIGPYISYLMLILASSVSPILFAVTFFFVPESPTYLLMTNEKAKASKALQWFRKANDENEVHKELSEMEVAVKKGAEMESGFMDLIATRGNVKALYLSCGFAGFQQLSGINVILFYTETIFSMTGADLSASSCSIIVGTVMLIAAVVAPPLARYLSMKTLFIISAIGMAIFQGILGLYFYLQSHGHDVSSLKYLPVASVVIYMITYCFGFGPLPWAVVGEMYPANTKAKGSAITAACCWMLGFIVTKAFGNISENLGLDVAFWICAGFCVLALVFTVLLLPNTRGLTLLEIQDLLNGRPVIKTVE